MCIRDRNYLNEKELRAMGQLVSGYLDFAERQAEREIPMTMEDWAKHLDGILTSTGENPVSYTHLHQPYSYGRGYR